MKYWKTSLIATFALLFIVVTSFSQEKDTTKVKQKGLILDIGFAPVAYRGDLQSKFNKWSGAFVVGVQTAPQRTIKPHIQIGVGTIIGQNLAYPTENFEGGVPNTSFYTTFLRANLDVKITYFRNKKKTLSSYLAPGIGLLKFTPHDDTFERLDDQSITRASGETYSTNALILPVALGLNYTLKEKITFQTELGYMNPRTDYIDNISQFGIREKKDNVFSWRFSVLVPIGKHTSTHKKHTDKTSECPKN